MTDDDIRNMPAGRDLDALVAEKVMGWAKWQNQYGCYSTDIGAAWDVVEKMRNRVWAFVIGPSILFDNGWAVEWRDGEREHSSSAPLAICRAALLAVNTPEERAAQVKALQTQAEDLAYALKIMLAMTEHDQIKRASETLAKYERDHGAN